MIQSPVHIDEGPSIQESQESVQNPPVIDLTTISGKKYDYL